MSVMQGLINTHLFNQPVQILSHDLPEVLFGKHTGLQVMTQISWT
jgi:hypothetical protein